jgi:NADH dehydrogenase [ubiquinone] 1 alpha subcomplex assembly factor 7
MADDPSPLEREIRHLIAVAGPMPVAEYMRLCLTHPQYGYYLRRDAIGAAGDFITAPEISQMFGELIGLWAAAVWQQMGAPENIRLIELGPGRGTMMRDALRAAKIVKGFQPAVVLHLVEINAKLKDAQRELLDGLEVPVMWHAALADVPPGPSIILANEFIDALPIHQAVKREDGWHERVIQIGPEGDLAIGVAADPLPHFNATLPRELRQAAETSIFEWRPDTIAMEIGRRVRDEGAALIIDYGHTARGLGETLQAVAGHSFADPLHAPGLVDLTAHVDFMALAQNAEMMGARALGPVTQGEFLRRLGIEKRAATLTANAAPAQAAEIDHALTRLTGTNPGTMGELFKVIAIADPKLGVLPGFEA